MKMRLVADDESFQCRRPALTINVEREPLNADCTVCITMDECIGQPIRYTELTPAEAMLLARYLINCAEEADRQPASDEVDADA